MRTLFTFHLSLFTVFAFSQTAPGIEWENTIGGNSYDGLQIISQTADGGFIIGGDSESFVSGDKTESNMGTSATGDYWIIKLSSYGTIEWQNTIGGSASDYLNAVVQSPGGGYLLAGSSQSPVSGDKTEPCFISDYWIVKLNATGSIEWQNTIGGADADILNAVQLTSDGGYILGGYSLSNHSDDKSENSLGGYDYWVVKIDSLGNIDWQNTIGGTGDDFLNAIVQTSDGGYLLGGNSYSGISGDKTEANNGMATNADYWIIKLDEDGIIIWQNTIGGNDDDLLRSAEQTSDGGYIAVGFSYSGHTGDKTQSCYGHNDFWIIKLEPDGSIDWEKTIGGNGYDEDAVIHQTTDGGYILGGTSSSDTNFYKSETHFGPYSDYWILKLDGLGNKQWDNTITGNAVEYFTDVKQTEDGGYIIGGWSDSGIGGDKTESCVGGITNYDYWIVKLFPEEIPACTAAPEDLFADHITTTKAKLHWDADAGAIKYKVQYRPNTTTVWTTTNATSNIKTLTGLIPNTLYKYRIRSTCSDIVSSPWSGIQTFTTLPLKEMGNEQSEINIYPNPNNGNFTIHFPELNDEYLFVSITNMLGEEIYAEQIITTEINHTISLDKNISYGVYLVNIQTKNKIVTRQIVIAK